MPSNQHPLTVWELIRIWIGGREYAEKRVPELISALIFAHQDENAVAGTISHWLRNNLVDENHVVAVYGIARILKGRGGRFMRAAAEALEALPEISEELQRTPAIQNAASLEERRAHFGAAMSDKFNQAFESAKNRLQHLPIPSINIPTGGHVPDNNNSPGVFGAIGNSVSSGANAVGGAISHVLGDAVHIADIATRFVGFFAGFAVLYCMIVMTMLWNNPAALPAFAVASFYAMVGGSAIALMIFTFVPKVGSILQGGAGVVLSLFFSKLLVIVFVCGEIASLLTGHGDWRMLTGGVIILVIWDRVVIALLQKVLGMPMIIGMLVKDAVDGSANDKAQAEARKKYWADNIGLVRVSVLVAGATTGLWTMLTIIHMAQNPTGIPLGIALIVGLLILAAAYVRMNVNLYRDGDYPKHIEAGAKAWGTWLYDNAMKANLVVPLAGIGALLAFFFLTEQTVDSWWTNFRTASVNTTEYTAKAVDNGVRRTAGAVEERIDRKEEPAPTKPSGSSKKAEDYAAFGGAPYCKSMADQGMGNIYPCD